jgi:hypothetical protein
MTHFKKSSIIVAAAFISSAAIASQPPLIANTAAPFKHSSIFEEAPRAEAAQVELLTLSPFEMASTEGELLPFLAFAAGGAFWGVVGYGASAVVTGSAMTAAGVAWAAGTGAVTGGVGGTLIRASGGGAAAQFAWQPSIGGGSFGLEMIGKFYGLSATEASQAARTAVRSPRMGAPRMHP